ncbi:MAG: DsbA family protein [Litorimonas sp.]
MRPFLMTSIAAIGMMTASCAEAGPTTNMSKSEIETLVKEYILENPEIIRDAIIKLQEKEVLKEQELNKESIVSAKDALENDPRDASVGSEDAKVTIVEFFDYNCGYCKRATPWVEEAVEKYGNDVRIVFKELPILDDRTKTSRIAARAALAADKQGKYKEMHFALMDQKRLSGDIVRETAEKIGLDMNRYEADMADPTIDQHINDTLQLANRLPALTGTPFFIVGDEYVSGADTDRLEMLVDAALKG